MKLIPLTRGQFAQVDDDMFDFLNQWKWIADYNKHTKSFYARRTDGHKGKKITMHRLIMNTPVDMQVDHKNHDTLNNQRFNLRNCTPSQNMMNRTINVNNTSGYTGIVWYGRYNKWLARISLNGKRILSGYFTNIEDAIKARKAKEKELFGEFQNH